VKVIEITKPKIYLLTWSINVFAALMYFIYYHLHNASNVPIQDSLLMFLQYYVIFILMIGGLVYYFVYRLLIKSAIINIIIISIAHLLFVILLIYSLVNLDSGSFFDRAP